METHWKVMDANQKACRELREEKEASLLQVSIFESVYMKLEFSSSRFIRCIKCKYLVDSCVQSSQFRRGKRTKGDYLVDVCT
jgi:hypothetical protein